MERKQLNVLITSQKQPQPLYMKRVIRAKYNKDIRRQEQQVRRSPQVKVAGSNIKKTTFKF